jgi:hypothetical protein
VKSIFDQNICWDKGHFCHSKDLLENQNEKKKRRGLLRQAPPKTLKIAKLRGSEG